MTYTVTTRDGQPKIMLNDRGLAVRLARRMGGQVLQYLFGQWVML